MTPSAAPLTPGAYLRMRRAAAGLSIADVAAALRTEPRLAEHIRADWLEQVETDVQPASFATIATLRLVFPFGLGILATLDANARGAGLPPPQLCRVCACSWHDPCRGDEDRRCAWAEPDLCTVCADANKVGYQR